MTAKSRQRKMLKKAQNKPTIHDAITIAQTDEGETRYIHESCSCDKGQHHFTEGEN